MPDTSETQRPAPRYRPKMSPDNSGKIPHLQALLWAAALAVVLGGVLVAARLGYLPDATTLVGWMQSVGETPWGLLLIIAIFCLAAFLGIPQFALIAATVAILGPWQGGAYAWIANMASGALTFWIGRLAGEKAFQRYAGRRASNLSAFIGRNALLASAVVRNIPAGPFVLVNMAFGISHARFIDYWIGMGLGILPKIALIAFAGRSLLAVLEGNVLLAAGGALAALGAYAGGVILVRRRMARQGQILPTGSDEEVDIPAKAKE